MPDPHPEDLEQQAWFRTLLASPDVERVRIVSRTLGGPTGPAENSFFAKTLGTGTTVRACVGLRRRLSHPSSSSSSSTAPSPSQNRGPTTPTTPAGSTTLTAADINTFEILIAASLGSEVSSHEGVLAGAVTAAFLDEAMGLAAQAFIPRNGGTNLFTGSLAVRFRRPARVPGCVLARGRVTRVEGRRVWAVGELSDGEGVVYSTGECEFVKARERGAGAGAGGASTL